MEKALLQIDAKQMSNKFLIHSFSKYRLYFYHFIWLKDNAKLSISFEGSNFLRIRTIGIFYKNEVLIISYTWQPKSKKGKEPSELMIL